MPEHIAAATCSLVCLAASLLQPALTLRGADDNPIKQALALHGRAFFEEQFQADAVHGATPVDPVVAKLPQFQGPRVDELEDIGQTNRSTEAAGPGSGGGGAATVAVARSVRRSPSETSQQLSLQRAPLVSSRRWRDQKGHAFEQELPLWRGEPRLHGNRSVDTREMARRSAKLYSGVWGQDSTFVATQSPRELADVAILDAMWDVHPSLCEKSLDGQRVGCKAACACRWYQHCFAMKSSEAPFDDTGVCQMAMSLMSLITIAIWICLLFVTVAARLVLQHAELQVRHAERVRRSRDFGSHWRSARDVWASGRSLQDEVAQRRAHAELAGSSRASLTAWSSQPTVPRLGQSRRASSGAAERPLERQPCDEPCSPPSPRHGG